MPLDKRRERIGLRLTPQHHTPARLSPIKSDETPFRMTDFRITMRGEETTRVARLALGVCYVAASRFVRYAGAATPQDLIDFEEELQTVFPNFFS